MNGSTGAPPDALLALDTATDACSVALEAGGRTAWRAIVEPRAHAARVLALIDEVMVELGVDAAELGAVAWCHGPGAFTGLRIAAGVAQGIAWGRALPVVGISTLAVLAQGAVRRHGATVAWPALDARMQEVYWGEYAVDEGSGRVVPLQDDRVCAPAQAVVTRPGASGVGTGPGWQVHAGALEAHVAPGVREPDALPHARDLLTLGPGALERGEAVPARAVAPVYLRDRVTG